MIKCKYIFQIFLLYSQISYTGPEIYLEALDSGNLECVEAIRNTVEQMVHLDADSIKHILETKMDLLRKRKKYRDFSIFEQKLLLQKLGQLIDNKEDTHAVSKKLVNYIDVILDYRYKNLSDHNLLIRSLNEGNENNDELDGIILFINNLYEEINHYGYKNAYLDFAIVSLFKKHFLDRGVRAAEENKELDKLSKNDMPVSRVCDAIYKILEYNSLVLLYLSLQLEDHFRDFSFYERLHKLKKLPLIKIPNKKPKQRQKRKEIAAPDIPKCSSIELEEIVTLEPGSSESDAHIDEQNDEPDWRWWLGYELEKKRESWKKTKTDTKSTEKNLIVSEEEKIQIILDHFSKISCFNLLENIIAPREKCSLKKLAWEKVVTLLNSVEASIDPGASGSRTRVTLNGLRTCFHSHGSIGAVTIKKHLRPFLISGLMAKLR